MLFWSITVLILGVFRGPPARSGTVRATGGMRRIGDRREGSLCMGPKSANFLVFSAGPPAWRPRRASTNQLTKKGKSP